MVYHTAIPRKWIQALILNKSRKTSMVMHSPLYTHSLKNKKSVTKKIKNKKQRITPPPHNNLLEQVYIVYGKKPVLMILKQLHHYWLPTG